MLKIDHQTGALAVVCDACGAGILPGQDALYMYLDGSTVGSIYPVHAACRRHFERVILDPAERPWRAEDLRLLPERLAVSLGLEARG